MTHTILEVVLCSILFLGIYHLLLAKSSLHRFKRKFLIVALFLSVTIPLVEIGLPNFSTPYYAKAKAITTPITKTIDSYTQSQMIQISNDIADQNAETSHLQILGRSETEPVSTFNWFLLTYLLVSSILLGRLALNTFRIFKFDRIYPNELYKGRRVVILPILTAPFSFFNTIYISSQDFAQREKHQEIFTHELAHIEQKHSYDIILSEMFKAVLWFNPFYYWFGKVIRQNHEYLADLTVIRHHKSISKYQILLFEFIRRSQQNAFSLVSPFNYSFTQKRFNMMTKKNSRSSTLFKITLTLALILFIGMSFTLKPHKDDSIHIIAQNKAQVNSIITSTDKPQIAPVKLDEKGTEMILPFGVTVGYGTPDMHDHEGIDFRSKRGTPVYATADGVVVAASSDNERYGNFIRIKHNDTYESVYASLEELNVTKGETVSLGQIIGTVGNSIPESNIHLHYEVIKNGEQIDPDEYFFFSRNTEVVLSRSKITAEISSYALRKEFNLDKSETRVLMFSKASKYGKIIYDQNKILLVDHYEDVSKVMKMSELSNAQLNALKGLKNGSYDFYPKRPNKEITDNWINTEEYMVVIDNKITPNEEMTQYKAEDFSYFLRMKLRKSDPEKPRFRVDLYTNSIFDKMAEQEMQKNTDLVKANNKLISVLDL